MRCFSLYYRVMKREGIALREHPADLGREPFPCFYNSDVVRWFERYTTASRCKLDQCMFGAAYRKPTEVMLSLQPFGPLARRCNHTSHSATLTGRSSGGEFHSTAAARYPVLLSEALAEWTTDRLRERSWDLHPLHGGPAGGPWESDCLPAIRAQGELGGALSSGDSRLQQ